MHGSFITNIMLSPDMTTLSTYTLHYDNASTATLQARQNKNKAGAHCIILIKARLSHSTKPSWVGCSDWSAADSDASFHSMSRIMSTFAMDTAAEEAHAVTLVTQDDAKEPMMDREEVALIRGMRVKGSCIASIT